MIEFKPGRTSFRGSAALLGWGLNRFSALAKHFGSTLLLEPSWIQDMCFEKACWKASMMWKHGKSGITYEHLAYVFNQGRLKAPCGELPTVLGTHMLVSFIVTQSA